MNQQTPRVSATGIGKRYGAVRALDGIEFELQPGEVMALLGENGAGKSTFVKMLSGLVRPDEGEFRVDGEPVELTSGTASQAAGIAVVQQEYSTVGCLSVAENLLLGQRDSRWWWGSRFLRKHAQELLERVGLTDVDPSSPVEELSVAQMQLLEIARVLARDAKVVIFDEPTAALSDAEIVRVLAVVRRMAEEGRSVIYVTHRLGEVFEIADRITVFRNGRSQPSVRVADVDVDQVITMMLGRELEAMFPDRHEVMAEPRLAINGLTAPGLRAPVDIKVRRGEILGITGQLGSGTDALMEALAGLRPVLSGEVTIDGKSLDLRNRRAGIKAGVAYCSSDRKRDGIFGGASIQRNLSSPWLSKVARWGVVSGARERAEATETSRQFALDVSRLRSQVGTLSGGNQQKVALGKWLGISPTVLLVEEPTRGVDVGARSEIYRQIRRLCEEGLSIVVASSDTNEILGLADTIATFYRGQLTDIRPHEGWTETELVRAVMHRSEVAA
ncbi:sugar ABC transporter ATP-binding protein [Streptomyces sp. NPDC055692]|uniref:sugar ABC transporter ATP-binding protein n=1 Tax=Streptomyces sp. NPDC055692 TaxID=3155683 RepID=UPI00342F5FA0